MKSLAIAVLSLAAAAPALAQQGVSANEIVLGTAQDLSGPIVSLSKPAVNGMRMKIEEVNAAGGINGRRIDFTSLDNGFAPPKALEASRKLVESVGIFAEVGTLGTPPNLATRAYLNAKGVPQLFVPSGITKMDDPQKFHWTVPWYTRFEFEAVAYSKYLAAEKPGARLAARRVDRDRVAVGGERAGRLVEVDAQRVAEPDQPGDRAVGRAPRGGRAHAPARERACDGRPTASRRRSRARRSR